MQGKARSGQNKRKRSIQPYLSLTICHLLTTPALHGGAPLASTSTSPLLSSPLYDDPLLLLLPPPTPYPLLPPLSPPDNKNIIPHRPHPSTTTTTTTSTVVSHHHHQQPPRKCHRKESNNDVIHDLFFWFGSMAREGLVAPDKIRASHWYQTRDAPADLGASYLSQASCVSCEERDRIA